MDCSVPVDDGWWRDGCLSRTRRRLCGSERRSTSVASTFYAMMFVYLRLGHCFRPLKLCQRKGVVVFAITPIEIGPMVPIYHTRSPQESSLFEHDCRPQVYSRIPCQKPSRMITTFCFTVVWFRLICSHSVICSPILLLSCLFSWPSIDSLCYTLSTSPRYPTIHNNSTK